MIRKIFRDIEKGKTMQSEATLKLAKDADAVLKSKFEGKTHELETRIEAIKESTEKDIAHLKETYNNEIKYLGQKLDDLRNEVHSQHSQLVQLLTKMIDKD